MSEKLDKKWDNTIKSRLDSAAGRLELLIQKLDQAEDRFIQKSKTITTKILEAYKTHETTCACVLAYDRVEIHKTAILIINSKIALEQIAFRLKAASEAGDLVSSLGPAAVALRTTKSRLATVFPQTEPELSEIGSILNGIMFEAAQSSGITLNFNIFDAEAGKILSDAASIAKQRIKEKFPES